MNAKTKRNLKRLRRDKLIYYNEIEISWDIMVGLITDFVNDQRLANNYSLRQIINMIKNAEVTQPRSATKICSFCGKKFQCDLNAMLYYCGCQTT